MSDLIYFERITGTDEQLESLQKIFLSIPSYSVKLTGEEPGEKFANELLNLEMPEGLAPENRFFYGVYFNHEMIGCFDLLKAYPDEKSATLSLLVMNYDVQGAGLGSEAFKEVEKMVRDWGEFQRIRIPFVRTLDYVMPFFRKMGFRRTSETIPYEKGTVKSKCVILEKNLNRPQSQNQSSRNNNSPKRSKFSKPRNSGGGRRNPSHQGRSQNSHSNQRQAQPVAASNEDSKE